MTPLEISKQEGSKQLERKKRVLVIFPYTNLGFSPTTLNLYDALAEECDVTILSIDTSSLAEHRLLEKRNVLYVKYPPLLRRVCESLKFRALRIGINIPFPDWGTAFVLLAAARQQKCDEVIGVDFLAVWVAQKAFGYAHLVSLELYDNDSFYRRVDHARIRSVISQTASRYDRLYPQGGPPYFLVQNAPVYRPIARRAASPADLVFCGSAMPGFGPFRCLDFVANYPEFRLIFKGVVPRDVRKEIQERYGSLLASGHAVIDEKYLEPRELQEFLSRFLVGLCCYDLTLPQINTFNYLTAPSGKLFAYYAAGLPVIGSDIPGLSSVREFEAGVLLSAFTPEGIREAITIISRDHARFRANSLRAAEHFSFDKAVAPFREFLLSRTT